MIVGIFLSYIAGIVAILSPCVLPLIPVIFAGSLGRWKRGFMIVLGMISMFTILGAIAGNIPKNGYMYLISYLGLTLFGITMISDSLFTRYSTFTSRLVGKIRIPGDSFVFGVLIGVVWVPCIGPIVGALLAYNALNSTSFLGAVSMLFFALGMATSIALILKISEKRRAVSEFGEKIRKISGYIILIYVILSASGILLQIELFLSKIVPV